MGGGHQTRNRQVSFFSLNLKKLIYILLIIPIRLHLRRRNFLARFVWLISLIVVLSCVISVVRVTFVLLGVNE
jgi:hypothetical protein